MSWLIGVPAWGKRYRDLFLGPVLQSHVYALRELNKPFRYIVHTDDEKHIRNGMECLRDVPGFNGIEVREPVKKLDVYHVFGDAHRNVLETADYGETLCLTNADPVLSRELLKSCDTAIEGGKRLVLVSCLRVTEKETPPIGVDGKILWSWTLQHLHRMVAECVYGEGRSDFPSIVIFRRGENVVMRSFHMVPIAFVKDRKMEFDATLDVSAPKFYKPKEIHIMQRPEEGAMCDITEPSRDVALSGILGSPRILDFALKAQAVERWCFGHRCVIAGEDQDCGDQELADEIALMEGPE